MMLLNTLIHRALQVLERKQELSAELFITIEEKGPYRVQLNDEFIGSASGRFRFFELLGPNALLTIMRREHVLYRGKVTLYPGKRAHYSYSLKHGLLRRKETLIHHENTPIVTDWN